MSPLSSPLCVPVSLRHLFPSASFVGCADIRVVDASDKSQQIQSNMMFAALPGHKVDGTRYVAEAIERGAKALLVQLPLPGVSLPQCIVPNVRQAYGELCAALAGFPSRGMRLAGVTGTNGKTTVTWLIRSILEAAGHRAGLLGTVEYHDGSERAKSTLTTPDPKTLSGWLAAMNARRTRHAALEVSSHALDQDRVAGTWFDVAVVTNVTQDHFDYHHDYNSYFAAKQRIFKYLKRTGTAVLNADDAGSAAMRAAAESQHRTLSYGIESRADVTAEVIDESLDGSRFVIHYGDVAIEATSGLVGRHNISNCLAAFAATACLEIPPDAIVRGIAALSHVPGRLERVRSGQPFDVFVDYAHTDDALRRCIQFLKGPCSGRVICVFGAGGDRDKAKRPLLAKAAADADLVVVTSDNPRTEDPRSIIADILAGFEETACVPYVEPDREEAIHWALEQAEPGDCVLIAGKGHECEQIIGERRIPFDDREVARRLLAHSAKPSFLKHAHVHAS